MDFQNNQKVCLICEFSRMKELPKEFFLPVSLKSSKVLLFTLLFLSLVKLRLFSAFNPT
jgi:hypothetical protein